MKILELIKDTALFGGTIPNDKVQEVKEYFEKLEQLNLPNVSGWLWLAKTYPNPEERRYTVLDKYGNVEQNVLFGCSGFMNEPYSFFEGKRVRAKDIIAYR